MGRQLSRLKALTVSRITAPGLYADGGGLYLQVTGDGKENVAKSWLYRFMLGRNTATGRRRTRDMGLGSLNSVSLAEARQLALGARRQRAAGVDPIEARKEARTAAALAEALVRTFQECGEAYVEAHRPGWRNPKHVAQWSSTLKTYAYPVAGHLPVQAIDTSIVLRMVEPIWTTKPETAGRLRGRVEAILDWATSRRYRQGENPARWRGHLENLLPKRSKVRRVVHHPALPYAEMGGFMGDLRQHQGIAARALEFTILTAARTSETIGARRREINFAERLWVVPAERIKAGREHRVALSVQALTILIAMQSIYTDPNDDDAYVFPGLRRGRPLSNMAMLALLERMGRTDLTTHGFRSSFRDWAAERTNFPREVAELALAHSVGDDVEQAYRRGDLLAKRRQLAEAWGRFCDTPQRAASVTPIGGGSVVTP